MSELSHFNVFGGKLFSSRPNDFIGVFVIVLVTMPDPHFFAPLLLSSQYLNPTVSCVSWKKLMPVMKHFFLVKRKLFASTQ